VLVNHLLNDRRFWAGYVAATHDPALYADVIEAVFGVEAVAADEWYRAAIHPGEQDVSCIEIPLQGAVSLQIDHEQAGIVYRLVAAGRSLVLGEISDQSRLPLFGFDEAMALTGASGRPAETSGWTNDMTTALVIGGSWTGRPSHVQRHRVADMWMATGLVHDSKGADGLAALWVQRVNLTEPRAETHGTLELGADHQPLSGVGLTRLARRERFLAMALGLNES